MIIAKLAGGRGNQLFTYSLARKLEIKYNIPMYLDLSFLNRRDMGPKFTYRDYDLDVFNINPKFTSEINKSCNIDYMIKEPSLIYHDNISHIYNYIPHDKTIYLDGYWQCDKYFIEIEDILRKELTFKVPISNGKQLDLLNEIKSSNSIMIHVRRGDYLNNDFHGVINVDYINNSINIIKEKVNNPKFYIFSDDIEWCENNLTHIENSFIVDDSYKDVKFANYLELMIACKNFIISNSTFSWWAAWLSNNKNKIVISPKKWFSNNDLTDIVNEKMNWIKV